MKFLDRLLTIIITATLTSAVWIVAGGSLIENATSDGQRDSVRPADAAPSPSPAPTQAVAPGEGDLPGAGRAIAPPLDTNDVSAPPDSQSVQLVVPVLNVRPSDLTDTYSASRTGGNRLHEAIDIMAPRGTSVIAAGPGEIEKLYSSNAGGLTIYVRSSDGQTIHYYAHLDEYAPGLREGMLVRRGQRIGSVGSSGNAEEDVPHLHFAILRTTKDAEWWEPANAINPFPLLTGKTEAARSGGAL